MTFTIALFPLLTAVGGAVDYSLTSLKAAELQSALDSAALAIATKLDSGLSRDELAAIGEDQFRANARLTAETATFNYIDPSSTPMLMAAAAATDRVEVEGSFTHDSVMGGPINWGAKRRSVVEINPGQPACVLALDPHAASSINMQGSTIVDLNACVMVSNSDAVDAVSRGGSAQLAAECVATVGSTEGLNPGSLTDLECLAPQHDQYPVPDPLADVVPPAYTACKSVPGGKTKTLSPGTYCNKTLSGDITLKPGTYILRDGQINLGGNGKLTGYGVTIFLMEGASITFGANQVINLTAPDSGPYAGISIYQADGNTTPMRLNGGVGSTITGFIYAPSAHVDFTGNSAASGSGQCVRIVANTIEMTGTSDVSTDCEKELGGLTMYAGRYLRIVR